MAEIVSFGDIVRARRRSLDRQRTEQCIRIVEANIKLALHLFSTAPETERPVRARQVRQLAELLEYIADR